MDVQRIIAEIDSQIAKLQQARGLLTGIGPETEVRIKRGPGRPPKKAAEPKVRKKRTLSPEARARIAAAQKKRWAVKKG